MSQSAVQVRRKHLETLQKLQLLWNKGDHGTKQRLVKQIGVSQLVRFIQDLDDAERLLRTVSCRLLVSLLKEQVVFQKLVIPRSGVVVHDIYLFCTPGLFYEAFIHSTGLSREEHAPTCEDFTNFLAAIVAGHPEALFGKVFCFPPPESTESLMRSGFGDPLAFPDPQKHLIGVSLLSKKLVSGKSGRGGSIEVVALPTPALVDHSAVPVHFPVSPIAALSHPSVSQLDYPSVVLSAISSPISATTGDDELDSKLFPPSVSTSPAKYSPRSRTPDPSSSGKRFRRRVATQPSKRPMSARDDRSQRPSRFAPPVPNQQSIPDGFITPKSMPKRPHTSRGRRTIPGSERRRRPRSVQSRLKTEFMETLRKNIDRSSTDLPIDRVPLVSLHSAEAKELHAQPLKLAVPDLDPAELQSLQLSPMAVLHRFSSARVKDRLLSYKTTTAGTKRPKTLRSSFLEKHDSKSALFDLYSRKRPVRKKKRRSVDSRLSEKRLKHRKRPDSSAVTQTRAPSELPVPIPRLKLEERSEGFKSQYREVATERRATNDLLFQFQQRVLKDHRSFTDMRDRASELTARQAQKELRRKVRPSPALEFKMVKAPQNREFRLADQG